MLGKVTLRSQTLSPGGGLGVYRYTARGFKAMNDVISYFKLFPLLTNKAPSFDKWLTIHNIVSNKLHLTEEGLGQVRALQKQININNGMTKKKQDLRIPRNFIWRWRYSPILLVKGALSPGLSG